MSQINIVTCGNAAGWENAVTLAVGTVQWSERIGLGAPLPLDLELWGARSNAFVASVDEDSSGRTDEIISFVRRHSFDLIVCESLFGSKEHSALKTLSASKSAAFKSVNRIAVACTHLGYDLAVGWVRHEDLGSSVSRERFTVVLRRSGPANLGTPSDPLGWYSRVVSHAEPLPHADYFEPCEPAPWQLERLTRAWWGKSPLESSEPFMVHSKYSGGTSVFKVAPIRWGSEPAYVPNGRVLVRLGQKFYAAKRPAIARILGFLGPLVLVGVDDKKAIELMADATNPDAAMNILTSNLKGT